ncbi:MAG TPA: DOMON-like domain-containing protein [Myxococcaceae bacterium]|nr:DOMON-like domain-containing protein [Candidatus Nitrosopolaris sp.]HZW88565.1 DOMON-like domain-containing protein [Myxococcaceae bacterium]
MRRSQAGMLAIQFSLDGEVGALRIPAPRAPRSVGALWEHTCFEVFVAGDGEGYHEYNFSPSSEWAAHAFRRYREGGLVADEALAPSIIVRSEPRGLHLEATVPLERLSPLYSTASLRLGLAAVIEDARGVLSYWALRHRPGRPDFHHADAFALRLETPGDAW